MNPGKEGRQYNIIWFLVQNVLNFISQSTTDIFYVFEGLSNPYHNSLVIDEDTSPVLDVFINFYEDIGTNSLESNFYETITPKISLIDFI